MRLMLIAAVFLVGLTNSSSTNCSVGFFKFYFKFDSQATMHADSGKLCPFHFTAPDLEEARIVRQPQHGAATYSGSIEHVMIDYKSAAGYKGTDQFVFSVTGGSPKNNGTANVAVDADVQ